MTQINKGDKQKSSIRTRVSIAIKNNISSEFVSFNLPDSKQEDIAIIFNSNDTSEIPNVRLHSECLTGDVFGSQKCDCGSQLDEAIEVFSVKGGVILYLRQEGRGIGLYNKLEAYSIQMKDNVNTYEANCKLGFPEDARDFKNAANMLKALGISKIKLLTNNPDKIAQLQSYGIEIVDSIQTKTVITNDNASYLRAKKGKGHKLNINEAD